jgi:hypothetical protein
MTDFKSGRREFIRFSSVLPLVAVTGCASDKATPPPPTIDCSNVQEHPPYPDTDAALVAAKNALWEEFEQGINAMHTGGPAPAVPPATKDYIWNEQGKKLARKMKFWSPCEEETRLCSYGAGVISELLRQAAGTPGITEDQFNAAKKAVRAIQSRRLHRTVVGIAC